MVSNVIEFSTNQKAIIFLTISR